MKTYQWLLLITLSSFMTACAQNSGQIANNHQSLKTSDHYRQGKFQNTPPTPEFSLSRVYRIATNFLLNKTADQEPTTPLPLKPLSRSTLEALDDKQLHIIKLGHSSILMKVYGKYWLLDPVFSLRASPSSLVGPKRFQPTPIALSELPPIEKVLISHNHYDHLDKAAIQQLSTKTQHFLVPIGVENDLKNWGVNPSKIIPFDWWQELKTNNNLLAFTPTQHFSGRWLNDRNKTLWGSWVIKTANDSLFFSGDSGYFDGFKAIGEKYGPFDLTMVETGAYNAEWAEMHMFPKESVQAHIDLKGKTMLPIHNGTFDLAQHPWYEPLERVSQVAKQRGVILTTPVVGEIFTPKQAAINKPWWRNRKSPHNKNTGKK